eukprot:Rhum_TRINITY_DN22926_c0_g1::Rhum_TRINITY_DN22926_c0_g1_i1::g.176514::m.176514/K00262/E1.4.1.4, gdhA; glutamate dehydrogenase (NADP+)
MKRAATALRHASQRRSIYGVVKHNTANSGPLDERVAAFMARVEARNPGETEFLQAVHEVAEAVFPFMEANREKYPDTKVLEAMTEAERIVMFRVVWMDDNNEIQVNRGYRIQMNSSIGPYKGGMRFHPSVNLSILKFLAFEQTFKNSLTTLPMGGGKGGSDFNPKGKSDGEIMRFCQSLMTELSRHIGHKTDVPAGDIGVGEREIGYLYGQYKRMRNEFTGVLTGKGLAYGGSLIRPEATGYGCVYFTQAMLETIGEKISGKTVAISGSGNVAQFAAEKVTQLGGRVVTFSDSSGCIYDPEGFDDEKLAHVRQMVSVERKRIKEYKDRYPSSTYVPDGRPWMHRCDIALPCATQNELDMEDAMALVANGCICVAEGANMPCTPEAVKYFLVNKLLFGPGKAANAGGVATSGLEMSQNAVMRRWSSEEVDARLHEIMKNIHTRCVKYGSDETGFTNYVVGANVAGFAKVATAMIAQGLV